jgi:hypothetical protein
MIIIPWTIHNLLDILDRTIQETQKIGSIIFALSFKDYRSLRIAIRSSRQVPVSVKLPLG